jgi:hypothetical protein
MWLGAALVVVLIVAIVARQGSDATTTTAPARRPAAARQAADTPANVSPAAVNLDQLMAPKAEPVEARRDPFRFQPKPEPPPPVAQRLPGVPDDQVGAPPPRMPAGPPPPPPITLKFIGVVQKADGTKIAVLSDGKRPIHGTEGEEIEGRYKILKIGTESIEIAYIDGRGRQTIRLTGQ